MSPWQREDEVPKTAEVPKAAEVPIIVRCPERLSRRAREERDDLDLGDMDGLKVFSGTITVRRRGSSSGVMMLFAWPSSLK